MTGAELKSARKASSWTQAQAALRLGVTQAYLSMLERGERAVSSELASRTVEVLEVPATALPLTEYQSHVRDAGFFQAMLGNRAGLSFTDRPWAGSLTQRRVTPPSVTIFGAPVISFINSTRDGKYNCATASGSVSPLRSRS